MPLIAETVYEDRLDNRLGWRLLLTIGAIVTTGFILYIAAVFLGYHGLWQHRPQSPFGIGLNEATPTGVLGAFILNIQSHFYVALMHALQLIKTDHSGPWPLLIVGILYGIFHAAGPGHGKSVISAYLLANRTIVVRGVMLCVAAAIVQACVAIGLVGILAMLLHMTATLVSQWSNTIELISYALVALFGLWMTWTKTLGLSQRYWHSATDRYHPGLSSTAHCQWCGHSPRPEEAARAQGWGRHIALILAAGIRPCSGAIMLLAFSLSQNMFFDGVAAVFAMALGTAGTTAAFAITAVFAKRVALQTMVRSTRSALYMSGLETALSALIFWCGVALFGTYWHS